MLTSWHAFATNYDPWLHLEPVNDNRSGQGATPAPTLFKSQVTCHTPRCMAAFTTTCRASVMQLPCMWQLP